MCSFMYVFINAFIYLLFRRLLSVRLAKTVLSLTDAAPSSPELMTQGGSDAFISRTCRRHSSFQGLGMVCQSVSVSPATWYGVHLNSNFCCSTIPRTPDMLQFMLVAWLNGGTSVFDRWTFPFLCWACPWRMTTYVGKPSAMGQL